MASFFLGVAHEAHHPVSDASHLGGIRNAGGVCWGKIIYLFAFFFPWHLMLAYIAGQAPEIFLTGPRVVLHVSFCGFLMWWWGIDTSPQFRWCPYCWWSLRSFLWIFPILPWFLGDLPWSTDQYITMRNSTTFRVSTWGFWVFFSNLMRDPMCRWWFGPIFWGPRNPVSSRAPHP